MNLVKKIVSDLVAAQGKASPNYGGSVTVSYSDPKTIDFMNAVNLNPWVHSAIIKKMEAVGKGKFKVYRVTGEGKDEEKERVYGHRLEKMLNNPCKRANHSDLLKQVSNDLDTAGETFWKIDTLDGELWNLDPDKMEIEKDSLGRPKMYWFTNDDGQRLPYIPEEIFHMVYLKNPVDRLRGVSPLKAASLAIDSDIYADNWNKNFFKNAARPDGVLMSEKKVEDKDKIKFTRLWKKQFGGSKHGAVGFLSDGVEYLKIGDSQKDMDFSKLSDMNEKKILAVLGVPREILGDMGKAATDTAQSSRISFFSDTVFPRLVSIAGAITVQIANQWYEKDNLVIEYDDPTPENLELKIKERESNVKIGARTPDEVRAEDGLDAVEGGDKIYIGLKSEKEAPEEDPKKEEKKE